MPLKSCRCALHAEYRNLSACQRVLPLFVQEAAGAGVTTSAASVHEWSAALSLIYRSAIAHKQSGEELYALLQTSTDLGAAGSKIVAQQFVLGTKAQASAAAAGAGEGSDAAGAQSMALGKLVGSEWSVGVTLGHSLQPSASTDGQALVPHVKLQLAVSDAAGHVAHTPLHLTVGEFRELHKQF